MKKRDPIQIYDARWEVSEFNRDEINRLLEAVFIYGKYLGIDTVTIAKDARLAGSSVMDQTADLAMKSGLNVYICTDQISTTESYFLAFSVSVEHPETMGITITASHNPANYIGLKITVQGTQAIGLNCGPLGGFSKIREIYHSEESMSECDGGNLHIVNLSDQYIKFSMKTAGVTENMLKGVTVVLDSFNGAAGSVLFRALKIAGAVVIPLRIFPDGNFPTGAPNPISKGKMINAVSLAGENINAIVIGTDGDGDRLVFGDKRGILSAGFAAVPILKILSASLHDELQETDNTYYSIFDPKVNPMALNEWRNFGITPRLFRNGHSQIKEYMRDIDAIAAIEESGHYYHKLKLENKTMFGENSLVTILLFLSAVKKDSSIMDKLWNLQNKIFTTGEFNYSFKNNDIRDRAMEDVEKYFRQKNAVIKTKSLEGINLEGTAVYSGVDLTKDDIELVEGWYNGYFRISTTEEKIFRSFLSADNADVGKIIENDIIKICKKYDGSEVE
jgi:phosphomannomutase